MEPTPITLFGLAYSSRLYTALTDTAWEDLQERIKAPIPDLSDEQHGLAVMDFLNKWRCRISTDAKSRIEACASLREWSRQWSGKLPSPKTPLANLSSDEIAAVADAFDSLSERTAGFASRQGRTIVKSFGPTGTAKVLFVFRPDAFPPWDDPIREALGFDGSGSEYCRFLLHVQKEIDLLVKDASRHDVSAEGISAAVGRTGVPLAKLIDEYYWMTLTQGCSIPTKEDLMHWLQLLSE